MRLLERFGKFADTVVDPAHILDFDAPVFAPAVIRRLALPDRQNVLDRLLDHGAAIGIPADLEQLDIGRQTAGADAHLKATLAQVVEHRRLTCHLRGMMLG